MGLHDGFREGKSESVMLATPTARGVGSVESFKQVRQVLRRDAAKSPIKNGPSALPESVLPSSLRRPLNVWTDTSREGLTTRNTKVRSALISPDHCEVRECGRFIVSTYDSIDVPVMFNPLPLSRTCTLARFVE